MPDGVEIQLRSYHGSVQAKRTWECCPIIRHEGQHGRQQRLRCPIAGHLICIICSRTRLHSTRMLI
ncbi:hypothetical protein BDV59DRAFT_178610 [Aspergillus ambiguus]|uniref:uncharacterized protein n=1 Tax=Aspergillus ambiguus TaxID=176160 RepID=UPI003CCD191A